MARTPSRRRRPARRGSRGSAEEERVVAVELEMFPLDRAATTSRQTRAGMMGAGL